MPALRILLLGVAWALLVPVSWLTAQDNPNAADEKTLQDANLKTDGPALLQFFRQRILSEEAKTKLAATVRLLGDASFKVREKATADLIAAGRNAVPFLRAVLKDPDLEVARRAAQCLQAIESGSESALVLAAARLLAVRRPPGAVEVILNYLPLVDDQLLEEELLAALSAAGVRDGKADPRLFEALADKLAVRRAAAGYVLGRSADPGSRAAVRKLLNDRDGKVRLRAVQGLIAGKDKEAVPALVALLTEKPNEIAWQAEELLCRIAGEQAPAVSVGSTDAERMKCREAWSAWWRDHAGTVDLARLDLEQRLLGLTLIVVYDGGGGKSGGKVWECGLDGKPRWQITDVQGPIDAQMLPGNRVLIAEYDGRRVTERDTTGKILWEHRLANQQPVGCQRLPNGNTMVATNAGLSEVTPAGQVVTSIASGHGLLFSFQKLRNGHVVYVTYEGMFVEVDEKGKELRKFKFEKPNGGLVSVEVLPGGRCLIPQTSANKVVEFDSGGKAVWQGPLTHCTAATRLPNGHTLACSNEGRLVIEMDRSGRVVWQQKVEGRPFRVRRR